MKIWLYCDVKRLCCVSPFAGEWIEIIHKGKVRASNDVSPFAGEWIEIVSKLSNWENAKVSPFAGEWIEIKKSASTFLKLLCLTLRG